MWIYATTRVVPSNKDSMKGGMFAEQETQRGTGRWGWFSGTVFFVEAACLHEA